MKKIIISILILAPFVSGAQSKVDRSKAPKPGPAPIISIADPASFTLPNGLRVFVVENTKLPRVSATLTIDRDPVFEGDKAGVVSLAGSLITRGTKTKTKAELDEAVDFLGGSLSGSATGVSASSLKGNFSQLMELMADVVLNPALAADELEKLRKQKFTGLQQAKDDPSSISTNVSGMLMYGKDHPYGEVETEATVKAVTADDVRKYYTTYWKPNIAYLVFVGDITVAEAKKLAEKHFSQWQKGEVPAVTFAKPAAPAKTYIAVVDRPSSVQSVIKLAAPIELTPGSTNAIPVSLMNELLGGSSSARLFMNLREKHGFTYGAYSSTRSDKLIGEFSAGASVRAEKTDSAVGQFLYEFNRIRTETPSEEEVARMKNALSGNFARSLEQPSTIAGFALNIARYKLPADYYRNYLANLARLTASDVQRMAQAYVQPANLHIVIVGNAKEIIGLEKYGEVRYFDINGNPVAKPVEKKVDASVTAASVLEKAVNAIGGSAQLAAVKDVKITGTVTIQGNQIGYTQQAIIPSAYMSILQVQQMELQKELLLNDTYSKTTQGTAAPVDDKLKEELNKKAAVFTDLYFWQKKYALTLKGIEQVDGNDAYVVDVKTPAGRQFTNYYDVKTGLKVKISTQRESPRGMVTVETVIKEYATVNGVKLPRKLVINAAGLVQEIEFSEILVNTGLAPANFQ